MCDSFVTTAYHLPYLEIVSHMLQRYIKKILLALCKGLCSGNLTRQSLNPCSLLGPFWTHPFPWIHMTFSRMQASAWWWKNWLLVPINVICGLQIYIARIVFPFSSFFTPKTGLLIRDIKHVWELIGWTFIDEAIVIFLSLVCNFLFHVRTNVKRLSTYYE
jgi:hypothetical protein